jgi:hypothetical protein
MYYRGELRYSGFFTGLIADRTLIEISERSISMDINPINNGRVKSVQIHKSIYIREKLN